MKIITFKKRKVIKPSLRFSTIFLSLTSSFLMNFSAISQNVGINDNGTPPDPSAILDLSATDKGLLMPRMTTVQRDAIQNPINGLMIYNTDCNIFQFWDNTGWISFSISTVPTASAGTQISENHFDANWSAIVGATTYYLDVATDINFTSPVSGFNNLNVGNVTSYNVTGLTCESDYYYRVRAEDACGLSSYSNTVAVATSFCCGSSSVTFTYSGSSVTYGTVSGQNGTCWMDRNLGASQVAVSSTDANSYGDYFQWGRGDD